MPKKIKYPDIIVHYVKDYRSKKIVASFINIHLNKNIYEEKWTKFKPSKIWTKHDQARQIPYRFIVFKKPSADGMNHTYKFLTYKQFESKFFVDLI